MSELQITPPPINPQSALQTSSGAADEVHEEALALMSMALDGLLDAQETERLEALMQEDTKLRATWQQWQKMEALLTTVVRAEPDPGFVERFEERLAVREARERARRRNLYGAAALLGWLLGVAVLVLVGWIFVSNQSQWMNGFVRELVYYPSAAMIWMRALRSSWSATVGEPQSMILALSYMAGAAVMLSTWLWFLRRTTRQETVS
jgi:anti-sigma factor RsiW